MKSDALIILLLKNPELGKVKTRLANSIGEKMALKVYDGLYNQSIKLVEKADLDTHYYFTSFIPEDLSNKGATCFLQPEGDLGEKMAYCFQQGFRMNFPKVIIIGSDCYDLNENHLFEAIEALDDHDFTIGPAEDGGYYLLGMRFFSSFIFENKPWSQETLLEETIDEIDAQNLSLHLLEELNDIDTIDDLKQCPQLFNLVNTK